MERDLVALATDANRGVAIEAAAPGKPIHLGLGPHAVAERFLVVAEELQATSSNSARVAPDIPISSNLDCPDSVARRERRSWDADETIAATAFEWGCNRDGSPACFSREMPLQYRSRQQASSRESVIRGISDRIAR